MANRERGELTLPASDGRTYTLRLTTNACCELEDRLSAGASARTVDDVVRGVHRGSLRDARWLLWAALQDRHADEVRTVEDAGNVIDAAGGLKTVVERLLFFMALNQDDRPQTKAEGKANPRTAGAAGVVSISTRAASA